jgi:hypothetical protein
MTRKSTRSQSVVERLLEQRRQYEEWLAKLGVEAPGSVPSHVAARVRQDYAARLEAVTAELREHEDGIRQALEEATTHAEALGKQRDERSDELAEARLRRQVGEFDEEQYEQTSSRCKAALTELAKEIANSERDIERFDEILALIENRSAAGGDEAEEEEVPPAEPASRAPAAAGTTPPQKQMDALDELAFLRSVVSGAAKPKAAGEAGLTGTQPMRRISGAQPAVPSAPPAREPPAPVDEPAAEPERIESLAPERRAEESEESQVRTLKCGECGTLNLPTEWYCEKCGAELSAF